jgi:hypothetical protein
VHVCEEKGRERVHLYEGPRNGKCSPPPHKTYTSPPRTMPQGHLSSSEALQKRMQQLSSQLASLSDELSQLKARQGEQEARVEALRAEAAEAAAAAAAAATAAAVAVDGVWIVVWGLWWWCGGRARRTRGIISWEGVARRGKGGSL